MPEAPGRVAVLVDHFAEADASGDPTAPAQSTCHIMDTLETLGYEPVEVRLQADEIADWLQRLMSGDFQLAFNLCETIGGRADGEHLAAAAVELLEIPMTGASAAALFTCLQKDRCAGILRAHGVAVPEWRLVDDWNPIPEDWRVFPAIVKPAAEDASNGIRASSVVDSLAQIEAEVKHLRQHWAKVLIQEFVHGREINLAIVSDCLLPPAEIDFSTLPDDLPPIVSFAAKWRPESTDFIGTVPVCPAQLPDAKAEELQLLAGWVWRLLGGVGYARVDVRLTPDGTPYVIDINPNPDLSLDAGLARQARVAGWTYEDLIGRIVQDAFISHDGLDPAAEHGWTILEAQPVIEGVGS